MFDTAPQFCKFKHGFIFSPDFDIIAYQMRPRNLCVHYCCYILFGTGEISVFYMQISLQSRDKYEFAQKPAAVSQTAKPVTK